MYPKSFLESSQSNSGFTEGPIAHGYEIDDWLLEVESNIEAYYGQFITRLIIDHSSVISPYDRFPQNSIFKKFFEIGNNTELLKAVSKLFHFSHNGSGGDVIADSGMYPILWSFASLDRRLNSQDVNYPDWIYNDEEYSKYSDSFLRQLNTDSNGRRLVENISKLSFLLSESDACGKYLSQSLQDIASQHSFSKYYQFCDLLLFHQIKELLFRQVAVPYHVNIEKTKRWKYKAKSTMMFMDMLVVDECRYVYDWMPTADMLRNGIDNIERQLSYRFALDGLSKHKRWYNTEYFVGTAVVDQFTKPFEAKVLEPRITIK